ncbi:family 65 glycosyl hydrolase domain-containing protein [[Mycoplasma] testudinis]|uniref:family 65 glycosyl hydrolase domain-containing protein n=1 Tax=[Mycoplasma] testudinis TaxID=33924 RepID=UPI000696F4AB|nr:family 65 glycosyl hydrolase domain-containing protein [[Mycoplasma] testudinis]
MKKNSIKKTQQKSRTGLIYDNWKVIQNELPLKEENIYFSESIFSSTNGLIGSRATFEETFSSFKHLGNYLGGVWLPVPTRVGWWKNGYPLYFGKMINAVDFLDTQIFIDEIELDLSKLKIASFSRELDMQKGTYTRKVTFKINNKLVSYEVLRFYSIVDTERVLTRFSFKVPKDTKIEFCTRVRNDITNYDAAEQVSFWDLIDIETISKDLFVMHTKTKENDFNVKQFNVYSGFKIFSNQINSKKIIYKKFISGYQASLSWTSKEDGDLLNIDKHVFIKSDFNMDFKKAKTYVVSPLKKLNESDFDEQLLKQAKAWLIRWEKSDILIEKNIPLQQGVRFCIYQLLSTYSGADPLLNIGPKGFSGEKYGGATYWDTEAFCLSFYLATADQEITKNLVKYRYLQLPQAIENAKKLGLNGALYPMVTFNGVECHNEWEITFEEIHRNASMVFGIYNYVRWTKDEKYLQEFGFPVIFEVAKFWASRVHFAQSKKLYMIHGVTGPNEYDNNVNNDWYTNYMAKWCLEYALECIAKYQVSNLKKYNLTANDLKQWEAIAKKMYLPYDEKKKIFVQSDTFLDKDLKPKSEIPENERPINKHWSWDKILRSCYIKQADVLQAMFFFPEKFTNEEVERNYSFYEPYTVHESSLSPCVHMILAARLNKPTGTLLETMARTCRLDLDNYNDDTDDGLHITSMSGAWLAMVEGFLGLRFSQNKKLEVNPYIPKELGQIKTKVKFLNEWKEIIATGDKLISFNSVTLQPTTKKTK